MSDGLLELYDVSDTTRLGVKGRGAAAWLTSQGIPVPDHTFDSVPLEDGGRVIRLGTSEFLVEFACDSELQSRSSHVPADVYRVPREDATFILSGPRALLVFAQTCGLDFRNVTVGRLLFTRVAGVSCSILPETSHEQPRYRLWIDPSYADYLWSTLGAIVEELHGVVHTSASRVAVAH